MNAATDAAYKTWAAQVKSNGGAVTSMPAQAGRFAGKPGALYPAATIAAKRLGVPSVWTTGQKNGYFVAPQKVWDSELTLLDNASYGPDGPSLFDKLVGGVSADNPLLTLGDRLRSLGTVAYWLLVLGAIAVAVLLVMHFNKKLAVV